MNCKSSHIAYINIGSNLGNRNDNIEQAVARIEHLCGSSARRAILIESQPWGYNSASLFLNLGIAIKTSLTPLDLFHGLQTIQYGISSASHRDAQGDYVDRLIDIDLIAMDELVVDLPELQLPHPHMHVREFVLRPMMELAPQWCHPLLHATAAQLISSMEKHAQHLN